MADEGSEGRKEINFDEVLENIQGSMDEGHKDANLPDEIPKKLQEFIAEVHSYDETSHEREKIYTRLMDGMEESIPDQVVKFGEKHPDRTGKLVDNRAIVIINEASVDPNDEIERLQRRFVLKTSDNWHLFRYIVVTRDGFFQLHGIKKEDQDGLISHIEQRKRLVKTGVSKNDGDEKGYLGDGRFDLGLSDTISDALEISEAPLELVGRSLNAISPAKAGLLAEQRKIVNAAKASTFVGSLRPKA